MGSRERADSPTHVSMSTRENKVECADSVNVPRDVKTHLLGAITHAGDGTGVTDSLWETGSCPSIERAVGGAKALPAVLSSMVHHEGTLLANL